MCHYTYSSSDWKDQLVDFNGQALGVSLLVAGGSMMASNIMEACGVDGKVASIISSGLDILAGIAPCFTPFASIGASMIGSGIGGLAGGFISEACGGSFEMGSVIGSIVGGILGGKAYDSLQTMSLAKNGPVVIGEGMDRVIIQGKSNWRSNIRRYAWF